MSSKIYVTKKCGFEACHNLNAYEGKCSRKHGHSYKVEVTLSGSISSCISDTEPATEAMVIDFTTLKQLINKAIVDKYDHTDLNLFFAQPTAEVMVVTMYRDLRDLIPFDVTLESVKLWETDTSYAEYRGE